MKIELVETKFTFDVNGSHYQVIWNTHDFTYSNLKYEVNIFRGSYKISYYTTNNINKSNSIDFLKKYLNEEPKD